jgi:hypothetical protein
MDNVTRLVFLMPPFYRFWQPGSDPTPRHCDPLSTTLPRSVGMFSPTGPNRRSQYMTRGILGYGLMKGNQSQVRFPPMAI